MEAKYRFDSFVVTRLAEVMKRYVCPFLSWLGLVCVMTRTNFGQRISLSIACFHLQLVCRVLKRADFICKRNIRLAQRKGGCGDL